MPHHGLKSLSIRFLSSPRHEGMICMSAPSTHYLSILGPFFSLRPSFARFCSRQYCELCLVCSSRVTPHTRGPAAAQGCSRHTPFSGYRSFQKLAFLHIAKFGHGTAHTHLTATCCGDAAASRPTPTAAAPLDPSAAGLPWRAAPRPPHARHPRSRAAVGSDGAPMSTTSIDAIRHFARRSAAGSSACGRGRRTRPRRPRRRRLRQRRRRLRRGAASSSVRLG